jgi:hypothetical protein
MTTAIYSGSHWCEVRGVGVEPTGAQGARPLHPLYFTDLQTAIKGQILGGALRPLLQLKLVA